MVFRQHPEFLDVPALKHLIAAACHGISFVWYSVPCVLQGLEQDLPSNVDRHLPGPPTFRHFSGLISSTRGPRTMSQGFNGSVCAVGMHLSASHLCSSQQVTRSFPAKAR